MIILANAYVFYADIYFLQNFLIKLTVLFLIVHSYKRQNVVSNRKLIIVAITATILEVIGLSFIVDYHFFILFVHIFEIPGMVLVLLGKRVEDLFGGIIRGYLFTVVINGVLEILWNMFGYKGHYLGLIILACVITIIGILKYMKHVKQTKGIYDVELLYDKNQVKTKAFYDSGNHLVDPYTQKGVHIISEQLLNQLKIPKEKKVCVPYQSLGASAGLIDVYYIENIKIYGNPNIVELQKIPIGVTKDDLFSDKLYKMILNEEVF